MEHEKIEMVTTEIRTLVCGDIHGSKKALQQVLERCDFDYKNDQLISLGDLCDGWSESYEVIEELLKIKNLILIKGNHDLVFEHFCTTRVHMFDWSHGASATGWSYREDKDDNVAVNGYIPKLLNIPKQHKEFYKKQEYYYIDSKHRLFVHGGIDRDESIFMQSEENMVWDRKMWGKALSCKENNRLATVDGFSEIFIGHTPTINSNLGPLPMNSGGVWNLDTGAGWEGGKLTIMDVDSKQFWQSDFTQDLHPTEQGRKKTIEINNMDKNEIKKALYREKPIAKRISRQTKDNTIVDVEPYDKYTTFLEEALLTVVFIIPHKEQGENLFDEEVPAQLLIRWL